jgi:hypothetical protein
VLLADTVVVGNQEAEVFCDLFSAMPLWGQSWTAISKEIAGRDLRAAGRVLERLEAIVAILFISAGGRWPFASRVPLGAAQRSPSTPARICKGRSAAEDGEDRRF